MCAHREKARSKAMHHRGPDGHVCGGASTSRIEGGGNKRQHRNQRPQPSPVPTHRNNLIFEDHPKKEPPNSTVRKAAEATPPVVLTGGVHLARRGGGLSVG